MEQGWATQTHLTEHSTPNADRVCAYILAEHGQSYSPAGAAKKTRRLVFAYKKPQTLQARDDEDGQVDFIARYKTLIMGLEVDELIAAFDAVHPEH